MSAADPSHGTQTRDETPFITPVIGIISNEDVPVMISTNKGTLRGDDAAKENLKFTVVKEGQNSEDDGVKEGGEQMEEESNAPRRRSGMKRKQPDKSESGEDVEVFSMIRSGGKRTSKSLRDVASGLRQGRGDQRTNESEEDGAKTVRNEECNRAVLETCMDQLGVESLHLPEDPSLCSIFVSCLCSQPRVVLNRLSLTSASANRGGRGGKSSYTKWQDQRRKSPVKAPTHKSTSNQRQEPDADFPGLDDKE